MTAGRPAENPELMWHAENVSVVEVKEVRRTAVGIEILFQNLEANARRVLVPFHPVVYGTRVALRRWHSHPDGLTEIVRERGDATLPRRVTADEGDTPRQRCIAQLDPSL